MRIRWLIKIYMLILLMAEDFQLMKIQVNRSGLLSSEIEKEIYKKKNEKEKWKNKKKNTRHFDMVERVVILLLKMVIVALG